MADLSPTMTPCAYTISLLPEDHDQYYLYAIKVKYHGNGVWAVTHYGRQYLGRDGEWSWGYRWKDGNREPVTEAEWDDYATGEDAWTASHRFDRETALDLAQKAAPHVKVNGCTALQVCRSLETRVVACTCCGEWVNNPEKSPWCRSCGKGWSSRPGGLLATKNYT